jgi:hypothetical protein
MGARQGSEIKPGKLVFSGSAASHVLQLIITWANNSPASQALLNLLLFFTLRIALANVGEPLQLG